MFGVVDVSSPKPKDPIPIDWTECFLCRTKTSENLVDPSRNPRGANDGYEMLGTNLARFYDIGALPFAIDFSSLDDGSGIRSTLSKNKALWHKSCYLKCNSTKLIRAEAKHRRASCEDHQIVPPSPVKTRRICDTAYVPLTCLFCGSEGTDRDSLRKVETESCDTYITQNAKLLKDTALLGKISERCDLRSLDAYYHKDCYTRFRNKVRSAASPKSPESPKSQVEALAFAGLIAFINECKEEDPRPALKMKQLTDLYTEGMRELGVEYSGHSTRLKEKILEECPYLQACEKPGQDTLLTFRSDVDFVIRKECKRNYDVESRVLCEAAEIVRTDVFKCRDSEESSQTAAASLFKLVKMIIDGPCKSTDASNKVAENIAQILSFHAVNRRKGASMRHSQKQETPLPVYVAMKIYGETRKRKLVDLTSELGLSISYDRLNTMLTQKANTICNFFEQEGVVCPPKFVKGVFVTGAVDNLDHNTSSTTASSAFHGTAISMMQHVMPGQSGEPLPIPPLSENDRKLKKVKALPVLYTTVQPCFENVKSGTCPTYENCTLLVEADRSEFSGELSWLEKSEKESTCAPWGSHHSKENNTGNHETLAAVLPLFHEQAHSSAMMLHSVDVIKRATNHLNPGQTPVIVADQPLFALLKQIQFRFPGSYGEDTFFVMMGGLHVEMAIMRAIGHLLSGSGWVETLVSANVTTKGRADSLLSASHVTRTRYAHQVTALSLFKLQRAAFSDYCEGSDDVLTMDFEEWRSEMCEKVPQFAFWDTMFHLELFLLEFVRSIRTADFRLYAKSLRKVVPWFFALDMVNYARWTSVHIRDLALLPKMHPDLAQEFGKGLFTARKTKRPFSCLALDHAHEQLNAVLKGDGGIIGLTEKPDSLTKWTIAGPELALAVEDLESKLLLSVEENSSVGYHNDTPAAHTRFSRDVEQLTETFTQLGNPFLEDSSELYNIDSKKVALPEVAKAIKDAEKIGEEQYIAFVEERLHKNAKTVMDTIKLNKMPLFSTTTPGAKNKTKNKIASMKTDLNMFSRMYISTSEHRSGDLDAFFKHENNPYPPSISQAGQLRTCVKSDLVKCLVSTSPESEVHNGPSVDMKILDGPVIVNMLHPGPSKTFEDYVDRVFMPFIRKELSTVRRLDLVWDVYKSDSLKNSARERRGDGVRTRVTLSTKIPHNWPSFLRNSSNKEELFALLSARTSSIGNDEKEVCSTTGPETTSTSGRDLVGRLSPCNHEEADTRMLLHVADAVAQGHRRVMIRTVDTDVLVIAVSCVQRIENLQELWIHMGVGKDHRYIAAHEIAKALGLDMSRALPVFHAFTGCDTVSSFAGKGKKTAFQAWKSYPAATEGFIEASKGNLEAAMPHLEKFVVAMYDRSCPETTVNACRRFLFTKKQRQIDNIPPSSDALRRHAMRAAYQGGHVWGQALKVQQDLPDPSNWGWKKDASEWEPEWSTLPVASKACLELVCCKCKKGCNGRCNCQRRQLKCSNLCLCDGTCDQ